MIIREFYPKLTLTTYNQARISFSTGAYKQALYLSQQVAFFDDSVSLGTKRLQCMCFYELGDFDLLSNAFHAFKMFLFRSKQIDSHLHTVNSQFLKIIALFIKDSSHKHSEKTVTEGFEIIQQVRLLPELEWIEEKLGKA